MTKKQKSNRGGKRPGSGAKTKEDVRRTVTSFSLHPNLIKFIDDFRGNDSRSDFIAKLIRAFMSKFTS